MMPAARVSYSIPSACPTASQWGRPACVIRLVSREIIADSIEAVTGAEGFDGLVAIGGCDKNMPACVMAMARLNRPAVFVYGGTIRPGVKRRDIVSVFEAVGAKSGGKISDAELLDIEQTAIPGPGACGGMYTANTMASAIEALGMSLGNSSAQEAVSSDKIVDCHRAGEAVLHLIREDIKPLDIMTREAFRKCDIGCYRVGRLDECRTASSGDRSRSRRRVVVE